MWHVMIYYLLLFAACTYALFRGGAPERIAAILYTVATLLTVLAAPQWQWRSDGIDWGVFAVDGALFAALVLLALHANRFWPIWASALQGFGLLGHVSVLAAPSIAPVVYASMVAIAAYPMLMLLAIGTWRHQRLIAAGEADPSWTDFSRRAGATPLRV
jgi:hypothetical protein